MWETRIRKLFQDNNTEKLSIDCVFASITAYYHDSKNKDKTKYQLVKLFS
jgi:hypothetical protein